MVDKGLPRRFPALFWSVWGWLIVCVLAGETRGLFTVDKCCISTYGEISPGERPEEEDYVNKLKEKDGQILMLPQKLFRIKEYNGRALVKENGTTQDCSNGQWEEVRVNNNVTAGGKFPGKMDAFYGADKLWFNETSYDRKDFCISKLTNAELVVKISKNRKCSSKRPCVQRCCRYERLWNLTNLQKPSCLEVEPGEFWNPLLPFGLADRSSSGNVIDPSYFNVPVGKEQTSCSYYSSVRLPMEAFTYSAFRIGEDGSLWRKDRRRHWKPFDQGIAGGHLCIEKAVIFPWTSDKGFNESAVIVKFCQNPAEVEKALESGEEDEDSSLEYSSDLRSILFGCGLLVFSSFHVVTSLVYLGMKDKEMVHRWTVVALTAVSALNFVLLGISKLSFLFIRSRRPTEYFTLCTLIGISTNFTFLTSLTWLSVANFDIWLTFQFLRPGGHSSRRLWIYTAVAFVVPGVIVGTGISLDLVYKDDLESEVITPDFGLHSCAMGVDGGAPWAFQYGPMALTLLLNVAFYISTGLAVLKAKSQTNFARSSSTGQDKSTTTSVTDSFVLFMRLFLVMGIPWVCEWISWIVTSPGEDDSVSSRGALAGDFPWYVDIFDIILVVQPALSFVILVLKKDVEKSLSPKYPKISRVIFFWGNYFDGKCPGGISKLKFGNNLFFSSSLEGTKETREESKESQEEGQRNQLELKANGE